MYQILFEEKYEELKQDPYADEEDQDEYLAEKHFLGAKRSKMAIYQR